MSLTEQTLYPPLRFSVAPMLDWTDRHCRYFLRQMSRHALLYTEMVTTGAILQGRGDYLAYNEEEHPVALQLGGSMPEELARCARIAEQRGYDEINLNVGCPSDRVQNGRFGACLMAHPALVADCVRAMRSEVRIPVLDEVSAAGCDTFIIHARKAWLNGLSPKENREIPPLDYERVYRVKQDYPHLTISINGGITSPEAILAHLAHVDGVMVGREAYQNPYLMALVDSLVFDDKHPVPSRHEVVRLMVPYVEQELAKGNHLSHITRHMLGLFQGLSGARRWRRHLSENACRPGAGVDVMLEAMAFVPEAL